MFLSNLSIVISHYDIHIPLFLLCSVLTPFHTQTQTEKEEDNNSGRREKEEDATQKKNTMKEEELHGKLLMLRSEEEQKQTTTPTSMEVDHKIRDFKIAKDEAHISYYAGYVGELFWTVSFGKMWHPSSWSSWTWSPLGPVILIIRRARLQKPTDCYPLQISNSWNHPTTEPILRYRLEVQVTDRDTRAKFVFWDNSSIDLLGFTVGDLQKTMVLVGVDDPLEYLTLLDEMMSITFAFRVKWQKEFVLCPVLECKDSKVLVDKIRN
ncbi:hypothetical protein P8452_32580 [Trifolium repens]|nr:hypothetical protein P8452_32580 [Trifolium repens]